MKRWTPNSASVQRTESSDPVHKPDHLLLPAAVSRISCVGSYRSGRRPQARKYSVGTMSVFGLAQPEFCVGLQAEAMSAWRPARSAAPRRRP
jgi:hypothetical protein